MTTRESALLSIRTTYRLLIALALVLSCPAVATDGAHTADGPPRIDPEADQVVRALSAALRAAEAYSFRLTTVLSTQTAGMKQQMTSICSVALQRPSRFAIVLEKGMIGTTLVSDGTTPYTYVPLLNRYTESGPPSPDPGDAIAGAVNGASLGPASGIDGVGLLRVLLANDPRNRLLDGVTEARYIAVERLDDTECHHLRFVQNQVDWDMWVQVGARPVARRVSIDISKSVAHTMAGMPDEGAVAERLATTQVTLSLDCGDWRLNPDLPATRFTFTPPQGVTKTDVLFGNRQEAQPAHGLVDQRAPDFRLGQLDAGEFRLSSATGKSAVILDFWATWCPPCVEALPQLAEVADHYRDRGVVLYAVNQGETADTVSRFLERQGLQLDVLLDSVGAIANLYRVEGIPQTVLIDQQGFVKAVHVGLVPNLKHVLSQQLDAMLAGKPLPHAMAPPSPAPRHAGKPIPAGPDAYTSRDFYAMELAHADRVIVAAYERTGKRDPRWDEAATHFLDTYVHSFKGQPNPASLQQLMDAGKATVDAGCDDPMVLYYHGQALMHSDKPAESESYTRRALHGFQEGAYSVAYVSWAANQLLKLARTLEKKDEMGDLRDLVARSLVATIKSPDFRPDEQRLLWAYVGPLLERFSVERVQRLAQKLQEDEGVDPWLAHLLVGRLHVRLAWKARGRGWARQVTESGWQGFAEHLELAKQHLTQAWALAPDAPEAATHMIQVAMAGAADQTPRFWFDRAVAAQLDYMLAYRKLRWALRPRWCGSHEAMKRFGIECLQTARFDTHVPYELLYVVQNVAADYHGDHARAFAALDVYESIVAMLQGYIETPPRGRSSTWYQSLRAAVAWRCERWTDARKYADELGRKLSAQAFVEVGGWPAHAFGEIAARTGPAADAVNEAADLFARQEYAAAASGFRHALALTGATGGQMWAYLATREWDARCRAGFAAGAWVDIMPGGGLVGWRPLKGAWVRTEDGALQGTARKDGLLLVCETRFGSAWEMRGQLEFVHSPHSKFNGALVFGHDMKNHWHSLVAYMHENEALLGSGFIGRRGGKDVDPVKIPVEKTNELHLQVRGGRATATINGQVAFADIVLSEWDDLAGRAIGVGGRYWYEGPVIRFRKLELRRLDVQPGGE